MSATTSISVVRATGNDREPAASDHVVVEEPLALLLEDETLAITMRTPGNDRELAVGFLLAEGIITSRADLARITPCGRTGDEGRENTLAITLAPGVKLPVDPQTGELVRRGTIASSACGVCGRTTIGDLLGRIGRTRDTSVVRRSIIADAVASLRARQPVFALTGGCHAASLVSFSGETVCTFEDVGRHNAVDKVVGACALADRLPLHAHLLVVSGRTSFEIVQKAMSAGISALASVSAPSSLAVTLAEKGGLVLVGFVRGNTLSIYAGADRIV
ncbi:MAG: Protein FdhD [Labilithrix sp.]|nr:Protein FdhD [Labilithrix sp.]